MPAKDIFRQWHPVRKWQYEQARQTAILTELGVARALATAFGGKKLRDLPEYEETVSPRPRYVREGFHEKFEEANKGRVIQTG